MNSRYRFTLLFLILFLLSSYPALKLNRRFYRYLFAWEYQKKVDLKRGILEPLQGQLQIAHTGSVAGLPGSATLDDRDWNSVADGAIRALRDHKQTDPFHLFYIDFHGNVLASIEVRKALSGELIGVPLDQENLPSEPVLTRSIGNAIRYLSGFSLVSYSNLEGQPVYGAWTWDRQLQFGMIAEIPAEKVDQKVERGIVSIQRTRRILPYLAKIGYGMGLVLLAWVIQHLIDYCKRKDATG